MPFADATSSAYGGLKPADFRETLLGDPRERTKQNPLIQVADLVLYPIAKGGYQRDYAPYQTLMGASKIIDALLAPQDRPLLGVKYSCFGALNRQDPA